MVSRNAGKRLVPAAVASAVVLSVGACAAPPRFALRPPVVRDQDLDPVSVECRPDAKAKGGQTCAPREYESSFSWDAADNSLFRPMVQFLAVDPGGEAKNVNAFDEVPDSSWFTNRIGARPMSAEDAARGSCPDGKELSSDLPDGSWVIDHGKDNGANPGFRVVSDGQKYMLKTDDEQAERATGATAIASRLYHAAGWWAACDAVVYFRRSLLKLKPGLTIKANTGPPKKFDEALLTQILSKAGRRGETYRAAASRWLPGQPLGPFTYAGQRDDDPSDVIPHEDRRDLRGARLIAAWLNHFDTREQNTMSTWMPADEKNPRSAGYVRHWYIDLGDSLGSEWSVDGFSRRHGHAYVFDVGYILQDFATLGIIQRPWDRARRTPGAENFGYFPADHFDPQEWRGEYPNPAFGRMTEHDGAWAARILARFTPAHIEAAVRTGDFTNPAHTQLIVDTLVKRLHILLGRYFARLSPVTDVAPGPGGVCATDLARATETFDAAAFQYTAQVTRGGGEVMAAAVTTGEQGHLCLDVTPQAEDGGLPDDDPSRYVLIKVWNGATRGPLAIHLYDLGRKRGLALVGLQRTAD